MSLTGRQKIGIGLIFISLLGALVIQVVTGDLVHMTSAAEPTVGGQPQMIVHMVTFTWRYAVPIVTCAVLGLCCLFIPPRRTTPGP